MNNNSNNNNNNNNKVKLNKHTKYIENPVAASLPWCGQVRKSYHNSLTQVAASTGKKKPAMTGSIFQCWRFQRASCLNPLHALDALLQEPFVFNKSNI